MDDLAEEALAAIFRNGQVAGLEMHKFTRMTSLPWVHRVFDFLPSFAAGSCSTWAAAVSFF